MIRTNRNYDRGSVGPRTDWSVEWAKLTKPPTNGQAKPAVRKVSLGGRPKKFPEWSARLPAYLADNPKAGRRTLDTTSETTRKLRCLKRDQLAPNLSSAESEVDLQTRGMVCSAFAGPAQFAAVFSRNLVQQTLLSFLLRRSRAHHPH